MLWKLSIENSKLKLSIKYIAEFIYGEQADKNILEEAVRNYLIIFVFDPISSASIAPIYI